MSGHALAAEVYRVDVTEPPRSVKRVIPVATAALVVVAAVSGAYWLVNPLARRVVVILLVVCTVGVTMVVRWWQGKPNIVLIGVGNDDVTALRARFAWNWKVVVRVGQWRRG